MFHYTNNKGYNAIRSQIVWVFKAALPPGDHPHGAYFTTLPPSTKNLSKRLFVRGSAEKIEFVFCFTGGEELIPLKGGRGDYVYYSAADYEVSRERQMHHGPTGTKGAYL